MMQLKKFTLPKTDERLITIDDTIFKIKIILVKEPKRDVKSYEDFCSNPMHQDEIEKIITILLTSKEDLQPIETDNLTVYLYQNTWMLADALQFYRNEIALKACPYNNNFYIQPKLPPSRTPHHNIQKQSTKASGQNNTRQTTDHSQANQSNSGQTRSQEDERPKYQGQEKDDEKCSYQIQPPKITENNDQKTILEPVSEHEELPPISALEKADGGTENESEDNEDGLQPYDASSPVNLETEGVSDDSDDDSVIYSTARNEESSVQCEAIKQDMKAEIEKCQPIKLISASEVRSQTRKRRGETLEEAEPRKQTYSVTEYVDTNRHEVQEQDLQELLRFQELATPVEEKPAIEERQQSNLRRLLSSVKKVMFGSD